METGRRLPSEYEVVSSDLHYNFPRRFELPAGNPVIDWYARHREGSPFQADDWEVFADPRRTTYRGYNELQDRKEDVVDGLLREIDETQYDARLSDEWVDFLHRWYAPLRFPIHGLQMLAAYVAQVAPASRITNCAAFQTIDEMRRLQRITYRTAQLAARRATVDGAVHRELWEEAPALQPLRELIERALVTWDWGEAFVVTNVIVKPLIDRLVNQELAGALAAANGDPILQSIHFSLDEDAQWHRAWSAELLHMAIRDRPMNRDLVQGWVDARLPPALAAVDALVTVIDRAPVRLDGSTVRARVTEAAHADLVAFLDAFAGP